MELERLAVLGALLGDALGVPHEFKSAVDIPPAEKIGMSMPEGYAKSHGSVPYGTWSDDGSQLLCLRQALRGGVFELERFSEYLVAWYRYGFLQAGGRVFDVGGTTRRALDRRLQGVPPEECGGAECRDNGNGSLMRVLPAAFCGDLETALAVATRQSLVTHRHVLSQACCAVYVAVVRGVLEGWGLEKAVEDAFGAVERWDRRFEEALAVIRKHGDTQVPAGSGYVVDTLWSAIWACRVGGDYVGAVRAAIGLGSDTDTTACVAGGLAAVMYGLESVPKDWWSEMRGLEMVW